MGKIPADFISGLNKDIAKTRQNKSSLYHAENIRIMSEQGESTGSIINIRGNQEITVVDASDVVTPYDRTGYVIHAYANLRNDIIVLYRPIILSPDIDGNDYSAVCIIDLFKYVEDNSYIRINLVEMAGLNFRPDKETITICRFENSTIIKIYWSDSNEVMRFANVAPDNEDSDVFLEASYTRIKANTLSDFNRLANFIPYEPEFTGYSQGSLYTGSVQYAYRLYNLNGNETLYSTASQMIPLSNSNNYSTRTLHGNEVATTNEKSGKSVTFTIEIGSNYGLFDRIEVIALHYSSYTDVPNIRIIDKLPLVSGTMSFTDTGDAPFGTLDYNDYINFQIDLIFKTAEVKDDRLFIGNIRENYFDIDKEGTWSGKVDGDVWDSRAYRFGNSSFTSIPIARLNQKGDSLWYPTYKIRASDPTNSALDNSYISWNDVPLDADCINYTNDLNHDNPYFGTGNQEIYQSNMTTLGAEGPNVLVGFVEFSKIISDSITTFPSHILSSSNIEDFKFNVGIDKTYQQDEIYRFGIIFFDKKGRRSFVKWITDLRIPTSYIFNQSSGAIVAKYYVPLFTLKNNITIDGDDLYYKIVQVKRQESDKTVLMSGIVGNTFVSTFNTNYTMQRRCVEYTGANNFRPAMSCASSVQSERMLVEFNSPDLMMKEIELGSADLTLRLYSYYSSNADDLDTLVVDDRYKYNCAYTAESLYTTSHYNDRNYVIDQYTLFNQETEYEDNANALPLVYNSGARSTLFQNYMFNAGTIHDQYAGLHGTSLILSLRAELVNLYNYPFRASILRTTNQYGGADYYSRLSNSYIDASSITHGKVSAFCYKGDTHVNYFEYIRGSAPMDNQALTVLETIYYPIESTINLNFQYGEQYYPVRDLANSIWMREEIGLHGVSSTESYLQNIPKYAYNNVYSRQCNSENYVMKPIDLNNTTKYDTRIRFSELKYNGEETDSWLKFRTNDFKDLESNRGELNQMIEFNREIICFQDTAIAVTSINPRVTQLGEDGIATVLGTGDTIDRYQYITTDIGIQKQNKVIKSIGALYWIDINKKKLYSYSGEGLQSLSDMKHIDTYFRNNITDISNVIGSYDPVTSSVYFTVRPYSLEHQVIGSSLIPYFIEYDNSIGTVIHLGGTSYRIDYNNKFLNIKINVKIQLGFPTKYLFLVTGITATSIYLTLLDAVGPPSLSNFDISNIVQDKNNFTIAYNELLGVFESFYSFKPYLYLRVPQGFFTTIDRSELWFHGKGDRCKFYNTVYPSVVEVRYSESGANVLEFNNLEYFFELNDANENNIYNQTMDSIQVTNDYEQSDEVLLYPMSSYRYEIDTSGIRIPLTCVNFNILSNIRNDVTHWRCGIPRALNSETTYDRIRSSNSKLRLSYNNTNNYRFVLHTLVATVDPKLL